MSASLKEVIDPTFIFSFSYVYFVPRIS